MANIDINLEPDPQRDAEARRAALALITATYYDAGDDDGSVRELSSVALHDLLSAVVGEIDVRPESAPALSAMLGTAARQFTAFSAVAYAIADQAFRAGQQAPKAEAPDYEQVLRSTSEVLQQLSDEQ